MKKQMTGLIVVFFIAAITIPVFAKLPPEYGLIKANKRKHIVRNYLYDSNDDVSAWITFVCQSVEGFQYSVAVRGLSPSTTYTVRGVSLGLITIPNPAPPPPPMITVPTSDVAGTTYSLGSITTNGEGEGEVSGMISLPAWHPFIPGIGLYAWEIRVADLGTTDVLWTIPADPIDFIVFESW